MGRKTLNLGNSRTDIVLLAEYPDFLGAVNEVSAKGSDGLVSHEEYRAVPSGDIGDEVVLYPASGTHA